ncbi:GntR family transcriptional regulator [Acuticoccus sediminis]|uniref:GntR family transcriptional regulator n=1 Tax=Acuticoccus sediminis TaxID=2184697 RepID=A0A8B2NLQ7_9HYPH|nr:GntR family transcriptional regulator [Acuticoccus sediminis]RAH97304.1 GntR family transcriptional regulator [Acuticoccus sediminis]
MRKDISLNNGVVPLHHQVYLVLRQQIEEEQFAADTPIPSEHELSHLFNVSRITIRRAMDRLKQEGWVSRSRGRGTFARRPAAPQAISANLRGIFENLVAMGLRTRVRLEEFGYVPAPPAVAEKLKLAPGATVQRAVRVRFHENVPFSHLTTYLPEDVGRQYEERELSETPLLMLMERAGVKISAADQSVSAKLADTMVAPLLGVETGSPLLWVKRTVFDQNDRPIEYLNALYRPDVYEYHMTMSRVEGENAALWSPDSPRS